jgi:hypothetical protein
MVKPTKLDYQTAHRWVKQDRGPAATYACVDCDESAQEWSYAHERATERRFDPQHPMSPYSLKSADYDPRCSLCHARYDLAHGGRRPARVWRPAYSRPKAVA